HLLQALRILDAEGRPTLRAETGGSCSLEIRYEGLCHHSRLCFAVFFCDELRRRLFIVHTMIHSGLDLDAHPTGTIICQIPCLPLIPGNYSLDLAASSLHGMLDRVECAGTLQVAPADYFGTGELPAFRQGSFVVDAEWSISSSAE